MHTWLLVSNLQAFMLWQLPLLWVFAFYQIFAAWLQDFLPFSNNCISDEAKGVYWGSSQIFSIVLTSDDLLKNKKETGFPK